jgi:transcription initiation factor TFIIA small subunit
MAAQIYSHTSLAECLYDVLNEMVSEGLVQDDLAVGTLNQLEASYLEALTERVPAKAEIKAQLRSYRYFDNVWQFLLTDVSLRVNATGAGSAKRAPEVKCDALKIVCVDQKLALGLLQSAAGAGGAAAAAGAGGGGGGAAAAGGGGGGGGGAAGGGAAEGAAAGGAAARRAAGGSGGGAGKG